MRASLCVTSLDPDRAVLGTACMPLLTASARQYTMVHSGVKAAQVRLFSMDS